MYFTLILMALATWRLANMLADVEQHGPFGLLDKIRYGMGVRFNAANTPYGITSLGEGILCVFCNSVWVGIGLTVLFYFLPTWAFYLSLPFALSAAAIWLEKKS